MIDARELRIGNLLGVIVPSAPVAITINHLIAINTGDKTYKPIPLTEDWLDKAGYEALEDGKTYIHPDTNLYELRNVTALDDGFKIVAGRKDSKKKIFNATSKPFDYLHQLQNFHAAAIFKELEFTL